MKHEMAYLHSDMVKEASWVCVFGSVYIMSSCMFIKFEINIL